MGFIELALQACLFHRGRGVGRFRTGLFSSLVLLCLAAHPAEAIKNKSENTTIKTTVRFMSMNYFLSRMTVVPASLSCMAKPLWSQSTCKNPRKASKKDAA
jgi:hypothetical protein